MTTITERLDGIRDAIIEARERIQDVDPEVGTPNDVASDLREVEKSLRDALAGVDAVISQIG
jgi:hypothetical protein